MRKVRYVYGVTAALLIGGSLTNVAVGPVGAQALNQPGAIKPAPPPGGAPPGLARPAAAGPGGARPRSQPGAITAAPPRAGAPMSFADLAERLQPAVVNISTKQSITMARRRALPPGFEEFFRRFGQEVPSQ